jgi:hypothetical protein
MKPRNIKRLQAQSRKMRVYWIGRNTLAVESTSNQLANHIVTVGFKADGTVHARCTCPWALNHGVACSHVMAALEFLAAQKQRTLSFWPTEADARRQKQRVFYLRGSRNGDGVWITSRGAA